MGSTARLSTLTICALICTYPSWKNSAASYLFCARCWRALERWAVIESQVVYSDMMQIKSTRFKLNYFSGKWIPAVSYRGSVLLPISSGDDRTHHLRSDTRYNLHRVHAGLLRLPFQNLDRCQRIFCQGKYVKQVITQNCHINIYSKSVLILRILTIVCWTDNVYIPGRCPTTPRPADVDERSPWEEHGPRAEQIHPHGRRFRRSLYRGSLGARRFPRLD